MNVNSEQLLFHRQLGRDIESGVRASGIKLNQVGSEIQEQT